MDIGMIEGEHRQSIASYFAKHHGKLVTETPPELQIYDTYVKILLLRAEARYADMNPTERVYETARLLRQIEYEHKKQRQLELIEELRSAESSGDEEKAAQLRITLNTLIKEMPRGKR